MLENIAAVDLTPEVAVVLRFVTTDDMAEVSGWIGAREHFLQRNFLGECVVEIFDVWDKFAFHFDMFSKRIAVFEAVLSKFLWLV